MRPDPIQGSIGDPQSLNRYSYAMSDPVNLSDPLGLDPYTDVYVDGMRVMRELWGFVFDLWKSGALDFVPAGAEAYGWTTGHFIRSGEDGIIDVHDLNDLWRLLPISYAGSVQKIVPDPITSDPGVLKELYCLWVRGGYGVASTERALWITNTAGSYGSVLWPWSAESKIETWKGPPPAGTVALAHTHGDRSTQLSKASPKPSTTGGNTGKGDHGTADKIGLPNYVVTGQAIWKAVPHSKDPVQVAGSDWWKPFEKAKVKCK